MKTVRIKNSTEQFTVGKIVCLGRNYAEHAIELGNEIPEKPVIFLKPASALIYSGEKIIHPTFSKDLHHEVELVLIIGKQIKNATRFQSEEAIIGYGVGLDMTLRDLQNELKRKGHPWTIAKCFDTSAVVSDFVLKSDYKLSLDEEIFLYVNGNLRQREKLNKMLLHPAEIVEYISSVMTLEEGDLIFTGTPPGVGKVQVGDRLVGKIEKIGELEVLVI